MKSHKFTFVNIVQVAKPFLTSDIVLVSEFARYVWRMIKIIMNNITGLVGFSKDKYIILFGLTKVFR